LNDGLKRTGTWTELPMPRNVLLSEVAAALQFSDPTAVAYLDRSNGQIVAPTARDFAASPQDFEPLPTFTEQDEIELAGRYAATVQNPEDRRRLQTALSSANPHEAFETTLFRCQIAHDWFRFRDQSLLQLAKDWLHAHSIAYTDDVAGTAD
jgi:hypothetical protein